MLFLVNQTKIWTSTYSQDGGAVIVFFYKNEWIIWNDRFSSHWQEAMKYSDHWETGGPNGISSLPQLTPWREFLGHVVQRWTQLESLSLPELRQWNWEFKEAQTTRVIGAEYQRDKTAEKELQWPTMRKILLHIYQNGYTEKIDYETLERSRKTGSVVYCCREYKWYNYPGKQFGRFLKY